MLLSHFICQKAGIVSSGIIFNSWLVFTLCGCPELYEWIQKSTDDSQPSSNGRNIAFFIWWAGSLLQTFLFCFADKRHEKDTAGEEHRISFLNHIFLWWFNRLPSIGYRKNLEPEDMFPLHEGNTSTSLEELWDRYWAPTVESMLISFFSITELVVLEYKKKKKSILVAQSCGDFKLTENGSHNNTHNPVPKLLPPSILYNIFKMFKYEFIGGMAIKTVADIMTFMNPLLLK